MTFVSTGFSNLDQMIAGDSDCKGFPRGGVSLLVGGTGSGKTTVLKKICDRAHDRGLSVLWIDPFGLNRAKYRVVDSVQSVSDLAHLMSRLLHPGNQKNRADLIVIDDACSFTTELNGPIAERAKALSSMFHGNLGKTAIVISVQPRGRVLGTAREYDYPVALGYQSRLTLGISKNGDLYDLKLIKSVMNHAGVSCTINPGALVDRSKIPTRYERILRGRN